MSQEIQIGFVQEGDRYTIQTGSAVLGDIVMDYSGYPEDARGGNSSILLLSAALSCYCGSIRAALVARDVPFRAIRATARGVKRMNAEGAMRLAEIAIDVAVDVDDRLPSRGDCRHSCRAEGVEHFMNEMLYGVERGETHLRSPCPQGARADGQGRRALFLRCRRN